MSRKTITKDKIGMILGICGTHTEEKVLGEFDIHRAYLKHES